MNVRNSNNPSYNTKPKADYKIVKVLEDQGFVVNISQSNDHHPKYSLEIGIRGKDGKFFRFMPIRYDFDMENKEISVRRTEATALAALVEEAEDWVEDAMQSHADEVSKAIESRRAGR